mgnify:CR=1 FL=1
MKKERAGTYKLKLMKQLRISTRQSQTIVLIGMEQ